MATGFRWTVENDASSVRRWLDGCGFGEAFPSTAVIEVAFGKASQRSVNLPIGLNPLAYKTCTCRVAALSWDADLLYPACRGVALIAPIRRLISCR